MLIDFVYHSTLGVRVIKKKKKNPPRYPTPLRFHPTAPNPLGHWPYTRRPRRITPCLQPLATTRGALISLTRLLHPNLLLSSSSLLH